MPSPAIQRPQATSPDRSSKQIGKHIGISTSGGDCPGLNAAVRGIGKAAIQHYDMKVIGFHDGFYGLAHDRTMPQNNDMLSGILTDGGTILGTSPYRSPDRGNLHD